ncbi:MULTISPECIES: endonuclease/exonuclease/phosphatase family protein [Marivita]|uniref:Endonuclease/exonuclease/phosphatase family protein n=1 Tax=Marivita cryptomonadis TaxID=505252 RepID=A0A9Q2NZN0_9RHOB|nr:endonuclease/exonuclease/phosphatase family protein [Marivita sp. LZ-15-2]MBM2322707.1 endonuclease/exonuclease/phosphatase family protein [Marivita cryptomonadis]MCR9167920.1 endonuclease/exonuclease/phosphatase family protein [Paracoccaceae bacterium]MBM2332289.1 endonuclease/exonuclease/phosphatase family protein [Marivita cryptomonadis]MBM2341873.1 endonuclease/exonuclease/phosphatase family protein [Marivita cryptomonadis]MBM2346537.1 endonuclease/exonuclease/phosphatase family protein
MSIVAALLCAAFVGGFAGALHPLGDSLAVFRVPIAVVFALWVIWSPWPAWIRWSIAVMCLAAMGQIVAQKYVSHPEGPITIYQKNLLFQNDQVAALAADIRATRPDIVTLQELTSRNAPLVRDLRAEYPHQASCALVEWARVAILSRWPVEGEICLEGQGLVGIQVMSPDGPFWAFSLHAFWPWPHGQADQLNTILPMLGDLEEPVVIAGDFNMVPWSYALRSIERSIGGTRAGPLFSTLTKMGAPLPIDHVYAPGGGQAVARPLLGSDHSGVLAKVFVFDP